jgi:hypothetical protein
MKLILIVMTITFFSQPSRTFAATKPDEEKQQKGIEALSQAFKIDPKFDGNIKEDWHPGDVYDVRMQEWKGSSDKSSDKKDCSMIVYIVKGKWQKSPTPSVENPAPHLIEAYMKIGNQPPAKMSVSYQTNVTSSLTSDKKTEVSAFHYQEKYKESKGGASSPEAGMAMAILTAPFSIMADAMTPGFLKTKSTYGFSAEKNADALASISMKSDGVNDKPNKREATCYNMKRTSYRPVGFNEGKYIQNEFENPVKPVAMDTDAFLDKSVEDSKRGGIKEIETPASAAAPDSGSGISK